MPNLGPDSIQPSPSSSSSFSRCWSSARRTKPLFSSCHTISDRGLIRRLNLSNLLLLGIGASIGAGIFVITGAVARDAGPVSFILAGFSCILNALCYAELASRFPPVVGGAYMYTYSGFNEITAFLVFGQLMLDHHIGAASIARSLASYIVTVLELFPVFKDHIPRWIGHGGQEFFGGTLSINILAPILLALITLLLCWGVGESSIMNSFMTVTKVIIVIVVICVGSFEVDVSNWSPFAPKGVRAVLTGATIVFFAYLGYEAVANSAEESKNPQRDLPLGIIGSLLICMILYIGVCLVITGMVPYNCLGEDASLAEAFKLKGLKYISILISVGAIAGLTTTLLVGLYAQSRLYLGLGRDGLLPSIFAKVHPTRHTPVHSQIWAGIVASILGGLFNVGMLSHVLSVGSLTGYSVVSACVVTLRWKDKTSRQVSCGWMEGVICLLTVAFCGFGAGLFYRYGSFGFLIIAVVIAVLATAALYMRQNYGDSPGFSCPGVPFVPVISIFFNLFLFAQLHHEAWVRFVVLNAIMFVIYAFYSQHHAKLSSDEIVYQIAPTEASY